MYAPVCLVRKLAELQVPGTSRRDEGGGKRVAGGSWRVGGGRQHMLSEIITSIDIIV
jgi:hypothetical protein